MKSAFAIATLLLVGYTLQTSALPAIFFSLSNAMGLTFLSGQSFNLVLQMLVYLGLNRDVSGALIWTIVLGVMGRWFGLGWNGAQACGFFAVALLSSLLRRNMLLKDDLSIAIFVGVASTIEGFVHLSFGQFLNQIPNPTPILAGFIMVNAALNAVCAPLIFRLMTLLDLWVGVGSPRARRALLYDM